MVRSPRPVHLQRHGSPLTPLPSRSIPRPASISLDLGCARGDRCWLKNRGQGGAKKVLLRPDAQRYSCDDDDDHNGWQPHQVCKANEVLRASYLHSVERIGDSFHGHSADLLRLRSMIYSKR
ncbi:uncharacterized protein BDW47DRAFT_102310 [Aspergillus candidus]|uniref:Uncharacterized protein n=1 Tax=Aspergillus candidus TaxID=41067 RepID=A0A2I2FHM2_ASPCN|nr:hypothetical protein BDW47DRAFT_102310 [Aspergillus candidus]PLB40137.1 hypothetical protein BDW47DRAFT_102310 [Aspergillus candidus]